MSDSVKIEGLRELDKALKKLGAAAGGRVMARVFRRAGKPVLLKMKATVPIGTRWRKTKSGEIIKPKFLHSRLKIKVSKNKKGGNDEVVRARIGVFRAPYVAAVEYGTRVMAAQPFLRPAWEATKNAALGIIVGDLRKEIEKEAKKTGRKV